MSDAAMRDLFGRWECVWHEGRIDLIAGCLGAAYIRHDEQGTRSVTPAAYAAEVTEAQRQRPHTRFIVYDHSFEGDRAWFRFTLTWTDATTGEKRTRAGMQVYRVESGKLAETWLMLYKLGSAWPDTVGQEHWTSQRP